MIRAGVFIGVDQTGGLQKLRDATAGAGRMRQWALRQGMAPEDAILLTDTDGGKVTPDQIRDAVTAVVDGPGVDQLILYFAGHGVVRDRGELWLLSEAPGNTSAAVDVRGSVELARMCGIPHVVVISDACRVAPEGIEAQNVRGTDVFPNQIVPGGSQPVDQFFACLVGRTAAEIKDPAIAATTYGALYTGALLDGLSGQARALVEGYGAAAPPWRVRPRPLHRWLRSEVPARVLARGLEGQVNQDPDAIITSDDSWLAEITEDDDRDRPVLTPPPPTGGAGNEERPVPPPPADRGHPVAPPADGHRPVAPPPVEGVPVPEASLGDLLATMTTAALTEPTGLGDTRGDLARSDVGREVLRTADELSTPFGADHFESGCGLNLRGAVLREVVAGRGVAVEVLDAQIARFSPLSDEPASVVVSFQDGSGAVIPAIPGYLASLTVDDGELVSVAYEPSSNSWRWDAFEFQADEVRSLRGAAAAAAQHGRFGLDRQQATALARRMQMFKSADPTLAVYAAYAYHDLQDHRRLAEMSAFLRADLHGFGLFDVELLAGNLLGSTIDPTVPVVPSVPLMAQGWSVLRAHRVRLPAALAELSDHLLESVWSLYDARGVALLQTAVSTGEAR